MTASNGNGNGQGDGGAGGSGSGAGSGSGSGGAGDGGQGDGGQGDGGRAEDRTFTQADVDRIVADRLTRERGKFNDYEALKTKAEQLDKIEEERATEAEKTTRQAVKDTEARVRGELEPQMLRLEVALEHGLPAELGKRVLSAAKRLVGTTRDELANDAKDFFASAPITVGQQGNGDGFDQGSRGGSGTSKPTVASGADLYRERNKATT